MTLGKTFMLGLLGPDFRNSRDLIFDIFAAYAATPTPRQWTNDADNMVLAGHLDGCT